MLTPNLDFIDHITNEGLEGRSATGVCMGSSGDSLLAINWRTKTVTEMTMEGQTIGNKMGRFGILVPIWYQKYRSNRNLLERESHNLVFAHFYFGNFWPLFRGKIRFPARTNDFP